MAEAGAKATEKPAYPHALKGQRLAAGYVSVIPLVHRQGAGEFSTVTPTATHAISSDGQLEVQVPATAVTAADIAQAHGPAQLVITQIAPPSGSSDGGIISYGMYLFQVQDASGHEVASGMGLRQPLQLALHLPGVTPTQHVVFVANGTLPTSLPMPAQHLGPKAQYPMQYDASAKT